MYVYADTRGVMRRERTHSLALLGDLAAELGEVGVDHLLGELRRRPP